MTTSTLSIGPYDLAPGQTVNFAFAYVGAENFHTNPRNKIDNWDPLNPQKFIDNLNFDSLITNAVLAKWVYVNPGYDTDRDGYRGEYQLCTFDSALTRWRTVIDSSRFPPVVTRIFDTVAIIEVTDTLWTQGDGVPDFRAAAPPEPPEALFTTEHGKIILAWNGLRSETVRDVFTRQLDFEGYRVYIGLAKRREDLTLAASYDIEDYTQWYYNPGRGSVFDPGRWQVLRRPFSLAEARAAYARGNPDWHPLVNNVDNPLLIDDSVYYFTAQDWNASELNDTTQIHKVYPTAPYPHTLNLDSAFTSDTLWVDPLTDDTIFYDGGELTPDGERFKYFEYRYIFGNLLPSQQYYVAVTAFDYGSPESGLQYLETDRAERAVEALAQDRVTQDPPGGLDVIVYPNPYRVDGNYRALGFEGRGEEWRTDERVRAVHFTNLPPVCDIKIYSLDGDMIRQIIHDKAPDDPSAMHD
ncbi:MAG TPA: hypothetical protein VLB27_08210, partial [candidate division Zixibacteria bacterium]|nr:hypothetical protein [candidate division Zixibacteria bacterium]